jgi:hypothetical protein
MSFNIPPHDHVLRPFIDLEQIASLQFAENRMKLRGIVKTRVEGRKMLAANKEIKFLFMLAETVHDDLVLIRVDKFSQTVEWNFGSLLQFQGDQV